MNHYQQLYTRLRQLESVSDPDLFAQNCYGIEKESLRVNRKGCIAQTPHPQQLLGAPLTHPYITTDFSEALLELITPPMNGIDAVCDFLFQAHQFVYQQIQEESLWATSMPCILAGETSIPIARYGRSNAAKMKTVYRKGLGLRYGREMQVIAGVHFNFSFAPHWWSLYQELLPGNTSNRQDFVSTQYFALIRNLQRFGWMIPYLFGASPAVCKSFLGYQSHQLDEFDKSTYYEPYATSLRMGDIGYQNNKENESGIKANYDNLMAYVQSLECAIRTPYAEYEQIGVFKNGDYQQLNANVLQIENEYYSTIRPKRTTFANERPALALKRRGVEYVELRSLDVNAFEPIGIDHTQLYFLETFLLFCLLHNSPPINAVERREIDDNEMCVAHAGREPGLRLHCQDQAIQLKDWGLELCEQMLAVARFLDQCQQRQHHPYQQSVQKQMEKFIDPDKTPSAIMLEVMRENRESFHQFAARKSRLHQHTFLQQSLSQDRYEFFAQSVVQSIAKKQQIEDNDVQSFNEYLRQYFES